MKKRKNPATYQYYVFVSPGQQVLADEGKNLARCNEYDVHQYNGDEHQCYTAACRMTLVHCTVLSR